MKIGALVVEDKESLNKSIVTILKKEGYDAFGALCAAEARELFLEKKPHIVLLDIMLPDGSGCDLIGFFKRRRDSHILMITALEDGHSKRLAYEQGADDYITKPFDLYELVYKLAAIRRRIVANLKEYRIGDITFDTESNRLSCGKKTFIIQPSQIRLLKEMYEKYEEGSYWDKSELFDCETVDENPRIQTMVARLRRSLEAVGSRRVSIETIYKKGYELVVDSGEGSHE